jgi:hypothetical protein
MSVLPVWLYGVAYVCANAYCSFATGVEPGCLWVAVYQTAFYVDNDIPCCILPVVKGVTG